MSESAPPFVSGDLADRATETLTPAAIETVLADFRSWLQQAGVAAAAVPFPEETAPPDLHTLLSQFVALRHEVNLQTKAARAQQEQTSETLQQLRQTLTTLDHTQVALEQSRKQEQRDLLRPLLKTLVDLHDALSLAIREVARLQEVLRNLAWLIPPEEEYLFSKLPRPVELFRQWWTKWVDRGKTESRAEAERQSRLQARREQQQRFRETVERIRQMVESFLVGYTMGLQRVQRAFTQHGLEAFDCLGQAFDPERMEVVEAVASSDRPTGEVLEEVRRGYLWQGHVFRYAQVKVAK